jgi:hypothetical protein
MYCAGSLEEVLAIVKMELIVHLDAITGPVVGE